MDTYTARDRSYAIRRQVRPGARLRALETIRRNAPLTVSGPDAFSQWRPQVIEQGEIVQLLGEVNAGDRGIEFSVRKADGDRVNGISAGLFEPVPDAPAPS